MEQGYSNFLATKRYAVVTGANKGIGFEICRQLCSLGIKVVMTARDEKRGLEAVERLIKEPGLSDHVMFHQLDVADPASVASLADSIRVKFGKLDILINNAGVPGGMLDTDAYAKAVELLGGDNPMQYSWNEILIQSYELAEECLKTNYYGAKAMAEALLPLLQLSDSARIVNVTSAIGMLQFIPNEWAKEVLSDVENLTEERVDEVVAEFLKDFKEGTFEAKRWPTEIPAYKVSKAALNAYTRILAKNYPNICVNSVCPGYVKTDMTANNGDLSAAEGAESPVRFALLPNGKPSGLNFYRDLEQPF